MRTDPVITRARALLGTPFRLHGRSVETGLDCVGLVALALGRIEEAPLGYSLRSHDPAGWARLIGTLGRKRRQLRKAGDVLLLQPGPAQAHLGIWTGTSLIHADGALGRVVETPGEPRWPVLGCWAIAGGRN